MDIPPLAPNPAPLTTLMQKLAKTAPKPEPLTQQEYDAFDDETRRAADDLGLHP